MIVSGNSRYRIVGAYVPLSDTTTSIYITSALGRFPNQKVILVGDLNIGLDSIETERDIVTANTTSSWPVDVRGKRLDIKNARGK